MSIVDFVDQLNARYESLHTAKEDAFWALYMGLTDDADQAQTDFNTKEIELQRFLQSRENLEAVREQLAAAETESSDASEADQISLQGWQRTFEAHAIDSVEGQTLFEEIISAEGELGRSRAEMKLGYTDEQGEFVDASSVKLSVMLRSNENEALRKGAWEGLRSIENHVLENGFIDVVKRRNRLGKMLGGEDFYDWQVKRTEGMSKQAIFDLLDDLEERTREAGERAIADLKQKHGDSAVAPWNINYWVSGDITHQEDPYFSFAQSFERWGRSFAALQIDFNGAEMVLDLVDRKGKHENGFMHGPKPSWRNRGEKRAARIQFTANAIPGMVGSGRRATETFFHEGGHASHFANIDMPAPCFAQEFAPTSVAFAEVQSMFLDSLIGDADWQTLYAHNAAGEPMPMELIETAIRSRQPFAAWGVRAMLCVPYAERAIYEMDEADLTAENILAAVREVEQKMLFTAGSPRPVLSVPHLLSGEASAYYHGYILAEMGVEQTRHFFLNRDGHLVNNPKIGPDLAEHYWRPGNSRRFGEFIEGLTGNLVSAAPLADRVNRTTEQAIEDARAKIARLGDIAAYDSPIDLNATIRVMHGTELVAGGEGQTFAETAAAFDRWVNELAAN